MARAKSLARWKSNMRTAWPQLAIKDVQVQVKNGQANEQLNPKQPRLKVGSELNVRALVKLGKVGPDDVSVQLYHGPVDAWGNIKDGSTLRMDYKEASGQDEEHWFVGSMLCRTSGRQGLAVRVLPRHADLINPYELGLILWEKMPAKSG